MLLMKKVFSSCNTAMSFKQRLLLLCSPQYRNRDEEEICSHLWCVNESISASAFLSEAITSPGKMQRKFKNGTMSLPYFY